MIRVLVTGAAGKMGREVVKAVEAEEDMQVVGCVDPGADGGEIERGDGGSVKCEADLVQALMETEPDVMVDFTHPTAVEHNIRTALAAGVNCVVGTTGLSQETLDAVAAHATDDACLFVAPNFAIGAVLMMHFAELAAKHMPAAEIIELHHDKKADAPSGTAMRTARLIAQARTEVPESPGDESEIDGAEGARGASVEDVRVHSVRLPGLVAHQEVIFGGKGQTLTIRHDSIDRTSFMPGVVLAVREVVERSGLIVGLENLMGE